MRKNGFKPIKSFFDEVQSNLNLEEAEKVLQNDAFSQLPPLTLHDAKNEIAKKILKKNKEELHFSFSLDSSLSNSKLEKNSCKKKSSYLNEDISAELEDEVIEAGSRNAEMKALLAEQIKFGDSWDPLHVRDAWVHLPHDFVEGGEMANLKEWTLKLLLLIKVRASKETGIVIINKREVSVCMGVAEKTIQRAIDELRKLNYIKLITDGAPVKGHGRRYLVIERLRMVNAFPVTLNKETEVKAQFPYSGKKFKNITEAARAFAKTGDLTKTIDYELELIPTKAPRLSSALRALKSGISVSSTSVQRHDTKVVNITFNVEGNVNAPININTGNITKNIVKNVVPEINLPDGRGNPLRNALKIIQERDVDSADGYDES